MNNMCFPNEKLVSKIVLRSKNFLLQLSVFYKRCGEINVPFPINQLRSQYGVLYFM